MTACMHLYLDPHCVPRKLTKCVSSNLQEVILHSNTLKYRPSEIHLRKYRPTKYEKVMININGTVSDKPRRLLRHQRAQAHNSTVYRRQHSFMYWGRFFCREPAKLRSRQGWTWTLMSTTGHGSGRGSGSGTAQDELWLKNRPLAM
jgi:hypothetical protein